MADELRITLDDSELRKFADKLRGVQLTVAAREIKRAEVKSLALAQRMLAAYPSKPPGSTYTRTGTLSKGWKFRTGDITVSPNRVTGHVFNSVPYAQFVQDERTQAAVHRNRWATIQSMTRGDAVRSYRLYFKQALEAIVRALRS